MRALQQAFPGELVQQSLDLHVLKLEDLLLPVVDQATEHGQQDVPGREQERHIQRRKPPVSRSEN